MSKNFTVEWLSQSYHAQQLDQDKDAYSHKPCVFPRDRDSESLMDASQKILKMVGEEDCSVKEDKVPSSPTNSCGYTSASESGDDSEGETGPHRRLRTKFTTEQISCLEKTFNKHKYLGATQRRKIAEKLHLSETQVKTWFQNRRMKLKREVQDMRAAQYFVPTLLPPLTSFQHHAMSGQRAPHVYIQRMPVQHQPMLFTPCYL
nr:ventral expressed homeobox [Misgurnus anguillicaudatus]